MIEVSNVQQRIKLVFRQGETYSTAWLEKAALEPDTLALFEQEAAAQGVEKLTADMRPPMVQALSQDPGLRVREEREVKYGNHIEGARNLGRIWAAQLGQRLDRTFDDLPPDLVHLMLCGLKLVRLSFHEDEDGTLDLRNYAAMSREAALENK